MPLDPYYYGLARVDRMASSYPSRFKGFSKSDCAQVTDVPVGQIVFCLPRVDSDVNWQAVVLNIVIDNSDRARLTWMHPSCLQPLRPQGIPPQARIEMTEGRGSQGPSINIGPISVGARQVGESFVLDARWSLPFMRSTKECSGHCYCLCHSVITNDRCFADILRFAAILQSARFDELITGHVCCHHAKHRSVAAGNILQHCFGLPIGFEHASRERCGTCCKVRAADHVPQLLRALRHLPTLEFNPEMSLAHVMHLPG
jgi:hypothetical protein